MIRRRTVPITLDDFTQSVAYREILGRGEAWVSLRQLGRKLPLERLEALAEALLDFEDKAAPCVAAWAEEVIASSLFLFAITLQQLELGVLLAGRRDSTQGVLLRHWLQQAVMPAFAGRILAVDAAVARRSAALHVLDTKPFRDSLIAATALVHSRVVVTRNLADFEATGVPLLHPWRQGEA